LLTRKKQSPKRLWCYLGTLVAALRRLTASSHPLLAGNSPTTHVTGDTAEISAYTDIEWYEWVEYIDSDGDTKFGRWLGVSETHGGGNVSWVLPISCIPLARSSVWGMPADFKTEELMAKLRLFDDAVEKILGDSVSDDVLSEAVGDCFPPSAQLERDAIFEEDAALDDVIQAEPEAAAPEADAEPDSEAYDRWLTAKIMLPVNGELMRGTQS
jgi:hypothetical protein